MSQRAELTVIVSTINGHKAFHFTNTKLRKEDIWFPMSEESLFLQIERVMVTNQVAWNVTDIEVLRIGQSFTDYRVTYNQRDLT
jgi:hypothetical protein